MKYDLHFLIRFFSFSFSFFLFLFGKVVHGRVSFGITKDDMSSMRKHGERRLGGGLFLVQATDVYDYTTFLDYKSGRLFFQDVSIFNFWYIRSNGITHRTDKSCRLAPGPT